jgi:hypothetical protein
MTTSSIYGDIISNSSRHQVPLKATLHEITIKSSILSAERPKKEMGGVSIQQIPVQMNLPS